MHEYRLADDAGRRKPGNGSLRLDDWVLCRLYNMKNEWEKLQQQQEEEHKELEMDASHSQSFGDTRTPESGVDDVDVDQVPAFGDMGAVVPKKEVQEIGDLGGADDWLAGIKLDDLQGLCPVPDDDFFF